VKKLACCLALGLACFAVTAAQAADLPRLPVKAAPAARAPDDWTGFYVGIQAGAGWGHAGQTDGSPFDSGTYNVSGGLAGVT
jgi:outer membrane immunogenic protein